jgi:DNA-binding NarL/FixJ family response regulator
VPRRGLASGGRILIVDDEPERLSELRSALAVEDIEVVVHTSPTALPPLLRSIDPDVILLDLSMPALPASHLGTSAPVILFSGRDDRELARLAEEIGAHGYLCKSDEVPALVNRVKTWIAASRALRGA